MNNKFQKGKLKRWNDDRGFGFVSLGDGENDVFIHISAFKRIERRPIDGDVITYQVHTDNDGKIRAVNAEIEGVAEIKPKAVLKNQKKQNKSNWLSRIIAISVMVAIGSFAYDMLVTQNKLQEISSETVFSFAGQKQNKKNYSCAGKIYCSEMTSCDEAKFYQRNCPGTKMDGDGDGIPCESQWCGW